MRGLSRRELGELVGISGQVVQRYESAKTSVSSDRLYAIARALSTPLEYFFEGLEQDERQPHPRQRVLFEAMHNFSEVQDEECLEVIREFTRALAGRRPLQSTAGPP
jgi:transcriptional regulator with XRE-family HTH domain